MPAPYEAIAEASSVLAGTAGWIVGSVVAADEYRCTSYGDVDVFVPTEGVLYSTVQKLLDRDYRPLPRYDRVWERWLKWGIKSWHTNSIKLVSPNGVETNAVFKVADGVRLNRMSSVIESFDFGLLAVGLELSTLEYRDMRGYLFPDRDPAGPLPLMPGKREAWRSGFISQYNGIREAGRYAKYHRYGYDLSAVRDDLVTGYLQAAAYHTGSPKEDKQVLAAIYLKIADLMRDDAIDEIDAAYRGLDFDDPLAKILEALE
jgi:hypothetical protein